MNFHNDTIRITNEDNMLLMARYPDKHFELAIIDPPYGINAVEKCYKNRGGYIGKEMPNGKGKPPPKARHAIKQWDSAIPEKLFFDELQRVSKNQIIWGGNYFAHLLPPSRGWFFWDKDVYADFADGELAWTSFDIALKKIFYVWSGLRQGVAVGSKKTIGGNFKIGNPCGLEKRQHPTQKPIALYKWLLSNYAKAGDKILDTHLGSGSIAIACADLGFDLTACELDTDYFNAATKRLQTHLNQAQLFQPAEVRKLESDNSPQLF